MKFLWPAALLVLAVVPLLIVLYLWLTRRRQSAFRYSSLSLVRAAAPRHSWLRRHLPFALFAAALAALGVAAARPVSVAAVPTGQTTIILAIDVSRSMCSTDVQPNRLQAAEAAAKSFVRRQPSNTQIGIVAFSTFAEEILPPTSDQETLQSAIESLLTGQRTAIGSGILKSIDAIAEVDKNVAPSVDESSGAVPPAPVAPGAYAPDIIVLLTDGVSNTGPLPMDAAQQARDRGVRVYTIGFGTADGGAFPDCSAQYQSNEPSPSSGGMPQFNWGGGTGSGGYRRGIDEEALRKVSDLTGGKYYSASSAGELQHVFAQLPTYVVVMHKTTEVSVFFAAAGGLLAVLAITLSLLWRPLP